MPKTVQFCVEQTSVGLQYVIPGTELMQQTKAQIFASDGDQLVIPGGEKISTGELLRRKISSPMRPRVGQKPLLGTALFSQRRVSGL